ncbi:N-acetyltransferase [Thalassotalea sp. LPB0316]|uniref:GNAT family N-acetyltransferase n=1 Tax=Thalassotalea sp. LPB0316 TaxID=2769490 RepID=UPI0018689945|nr:GNAT family N-acetyltransferase [Thalassotalea sp. LPB0316]QOL26085.1 N-acetyltransferase [Thalassotalea sp. LPB0316]
MQLVNCQFKQHGEKVQALFNHAIRHSTALYEYRERSKQDIEQWFNTKHEQGFPIIAMEDDNGQLMGFASYGFFRPYPANKFTGVLAIYVEQAHQGKGVASKLLQALIEKAKLQGLHTLIAAIDENNHASIALHQKFGFEHVGTLKEVGYKFDQWLNLCLYQLMVS